MTALRALMPEPEAVPRLRARTVRMAIAALALMGLLFAVDQGLVSLFGHGRG